MTFHIVTLFPSAFDSYLQESIIGRAIWGKKIKVRFYNPRDHARGKPPKENALRHKQGDVNLFGGGPGMVLKAEPILKAVEMAFKKIRSTKSEVLNKSKNQNPKIKTLIFSPGG